MKIEIYFRMVSKLHIRFFSLPVIVIFQLDDIPKPILKNNCHIVKRVK